MREEEVKNFDLFRVFPLAEKGICCIIGVCGLEPQLMTSEAVEVEGKKKLGEPIFSLAIECGNAV